MDFTKSLNQSFTTFSKQYFNNMTNKTITVNGTVIDDKVIQLKTGQEEEDRSSLPLTILIVIIISVILFLLYKKFISDSGQKEEKPKPKPINFKKTALKMLKEADELYNQKRYKDAYAKASEALRFYHSHKYGNRTELTSVETIALLKKHKVKWSNTNKALNLANMVEFAKYKPNRKDFSEIQRLAKIEII
jgi:hypothetical protein